MTLRMNKVYLIVFILLFLIVGIVIKMRLNNNSNSDSKAEVDNYQYQVNKPQLVSYSNGEKRWDIESETITQPKTDDEEQVKVILKNIKEGKLYSNDKLKYRVDANKIIYYEKSKDIELHGNVSLAEIKGDKMTSDFFAWDEKNKNLSTDEGVTVQMKDGELTAQNMNLDLETQIIDFTDDVVMTFKVEGAENDEK